MLRKAHRSLLTLSTLTARSCLPLLPMSGASCVLAMARAMLTCNAYIRIDIYIHVPIACASALWWRVKTQQLHSCTCAVHSSHRWGCA